MRRLCLGFACLWSRQRQATWSYTAARLRSALARGSMDVVDLEAQPGPALRVLLRGAAELTPGVPWKYSAHYLRYMDRRVATAAAGARPDVVLGIGEADTVLAGVPTVLYQDMTAMIALGLLRAGHAHGVCLDAASDATLARLADRHLEQLRRAARVATMSRWYADVLVDELGLDRRRVHVVPPGMNSAPARRRDPATLRSGRLLFVGVDFQRKGGDLVVRAAERLRQGGIPVELTVAGPARWPGGGAPPAWVRFLGRVSPATVAEAYAEHDLFVMPSRYEPFGIVFAEALAAGLPVVARRAFAMPEIVGDLGRLVDGDDVDALAAAIHGALGDDALYDRVARARPELVERYSWAPAARRLEALGAEALGS